MNTAGLTWIECRKIMARPRSLIGFGAITLIVFLIQIAMLMGGENYIGFITNQIQSSFILEGTVLNGNLVCFIILQTLIIQIPLLVALVTGDLISGEAASGTFRLLVAKPISRTAIVVSKFFAGSLYTLALLIWMGVLALGLSLLIFGPGDLIVLKTDELIILKSDDTLWRFFSAFGIAFLSLMVVASFSMLLSCFAENSIGPIISTMAVIILFTIIGTIEVPLFDLIKPFLFTTHMVIWRSFFEYPVPAQQVELSAAVLTGHILVFMAASIIIINRKDITT